MGVNCQRRQNHLRFHSIIHLLLLPSSLAFLLPVIIGKDYRYFQCSPPRLFFCATKYAKEENTPGRYPKKAQVRQKPQHRRPRKYWTDIGTVRQELWELWRWANVTVPAESPPPIPSESLLNYWRRHDLRAAIVTHGGRELLAESLGGAFVIPGKWKLAVQTAIVQQLLTRDPQLLADAPPPRIEHARRTRSNALTNNTNQTIKSLNNQRWKHSDHRRPFGYWTSQAKVIEELYQFLEQRSQRDNIPEAWMPRLSEINSQDRYDLVVAVRAFGGPKLICHKAGLVPFREWNYIEGMYELLMRLRSYLDQYHGGDYTIFPVASHLKRQGYDRLYSLIKYYGGAKFLSARLHMGTFGGRKRRGGRDKRQLLAADMSWGPFDLEFGIELYAFVREQHSHQKPPLKHPEIRIPSQSTLLAHGDRGMYLDNKIQEYGGYENVARRLGLAFSFQSL